MPSPELQIVIDMLRAAPIFGSGDLAAMRAGMEAMAGAQAPPDDVFREDVDAGGVAAEWIRCDGVREDRCILYFHGGAYVMGSPRTHRNLVAGIARAARAPVLSVDYRLAPEAPFPAAVDDGVRAYDFLRSSGFAARRIGVAGDSAGGGLAAATLLALRERGTELPAAAACISPWFDLALTGHSMHNNEDIDPMIRRADLDRMAAAYAAGQDRRAPLISPMYADLSGLPEFLIHVGTAEALLDDSLTFGQRMEEANGTITVDVFQDMIHVWHAFAAILPEGRVAIERIGKYFDDRLGS